MMKIVTGHQPVYLPWLGLFHKISLADEFVFMDDVQFLRQDWNNRNYIKGGQGKVRLTVPVRTESSSDLLKDVRVQSESFGGKKHWQASHWKSIVCNYSRAPFFEAHAAFFEDFYVHTKWEWLSELNLSLLRYFMDALGLQTRIIVASEQGFAGKKSDLVLDHCTRLGAQGCVLGEQGRNYLKTEDFLERGIAVYFQNYVHPTYSQRFQGFVSHLSVLDLIMNVGAEALGVLIGDNVTRADVEQRMRDRPDGGE